MTTVESYKIVSGDDHMDMHTLPPKLFEERLPKQWRDRAPHVVSTPTGASWVADGETFGSSGKQRGKGVVWAFEKAGLDDDGYRPSSAQLRLHDMDLDGVYAQVIYGPVKGLQLKDQALAEACLSVYNDWAVEFNSADPNRLCLLGYLPSRSPAAAAKEAARIAKAGHKGALLAVFEDCVPIYDAAWEPLWQVAHETGLVLSFHFGGGTSMVKGVPGSWMQPAYVSCLPLQLDERLASMIFCGALSRHPNMRLVIAECGIGWMPYFLERMELMYDTYNHLTKDLPLKERPRQIFERQAYVTFQEDPIGIPLIDRIGVNNVMWASDYPHPNSTFPYSKKAIETIFTGIDPEITRKVTRDNAANLYGLEAAFD